MIISLPGFGAPRSYGLRRLHFYELLTIFPADPDYRGNTPDLSSPDIARGNHPWRAVGSAAKSRLDHSTIT